MPNSIDCVIVYEYIDPDKNFALEVYGDNSKCFDHTNQMWEEQTCKQVRQWQHWGSGCYEYSCQNGRLHIIVSTYFSNLIYRREQGKTYISNLNHLFYKILLYIN